MKCVPKWPKKSKNFSSSYSSFPFHKFSSTKAKKLSSSSGGLTGS